MEEVPEVTPPAEEVVTEPEPTNPEIEAAPEPEVNAEAEKHRLAFEDQKRRAEKAEKELKDFKAKGAAPSKEQDASALQQGIAQANERAERAELVAAGYAHPEDQQFLRDAAKRLGVEPLEAADDELVKGKIERMREARKTKDATPPPKGGGTPKKPTKTAWDMTEEEFQKENARVMSGRS